MTTQTHQYRYGTLTITGRMLNPNTRVDVWIATGLEKPTTQTCRVLSKYDQTPPVTGDETNPNYRRYNPVCSFCYFGHTHSTALHDSRIEEK